MNIRSSLILVFFSFVRIFAQQDIDTIPRDANLNYFKSTRETVFLHLNKSTYISGEEIWFKGYVYDRKKNKPFLKTSNFNIEIFNSQGKEIYSGLFLGYQGITKGNIRVDSTWTTGNYYVRLSTNWMNNFIEDDSYTKKIKLVNVAISKNTNEIKEKEYDFQLFPEGGYLVNETKNTIGFKINDENGYGIKYCDGVVIDETGTILKSFKSNKLGIGKFDINLQKEKKYTVIAKLRNDKEINAEFPEIKNNGISLSVNNLFPDKVVLEFNWNNHMQQLLTQKRYYILVHQNGLSKKITINFPSDNISKTIFLDRKEMFSGVNTITLFEDNRPILERLIYNRSDIPLRDINISYLNKTKDSLIFSINVPPKSKVAYDVSVSVLPKETKSYNFEDNILSAILLKPYVKGYIEDSKYYFVDVNRRKTYDLDLLLLTQGWSKYKWKNKLNPQSDYKYSFNQGLTLKGTLQGSKIKDLDQVYLFPTNNSGYRFIDLDSSNSFVLNNFFVDTNEEISMSALNTKGVPIKIGSYITIKQNRLKKSLNKKLIAPSLSKINSIDGDIKVPKGFFNDFETLEEVLIKGKKSEIKNVNEQSFFYREHSKKVTEKDAQVYNTVLDYIRVTSGKFKVDVNLFSPEPVKISLRVPITLINKNETSIYIDDVQIGDPSVLLSILMSEVESVYLDNTGFGEGVRGGAGVIRIYTRKTVLDNISNAGGATQAVFGHKVKKGFEPVKSFYRPLYSNQVDQFFINNGVIHWEPQLLIFENGKGVFKIPNTQLKEITFYIEGFGSDGSLISRIQTINLD